MCVCVLDKIMETPGNFKFILIWCRTAFIYIYIYIYIRVCAAPFIQFLRKLAS